MCSRPTGLVSRIASRRWSTIIFSVGGLVEGGTDSRTHGHSVAVGRSISANVAPDADMCNDIVLIWPAIDGKPPDDSKPTAVVECVANPAELLGEGVGQRKGFGIGHGHISQGEGCGRLVANE